MAKNLFIERRELTALLDDSLRRPIISVVAGAGYGKTQAIRAFLKDREKRGLPTAAAWIQLTERDNIPERFWENFTAAVGGISAESAARLKENGFPETGRQFERYVVIPRNRVDPGLRYIFVYDDFHLLTDKRVLGFLARSISSPFPMITSILVSRREPVFDTLNLLTLKSKGLLQEITQEDLQFSREEINAYFRLQDIRLPPEGVDAVYQDTEGWAFAVHLAALSAGAGSFYTPGALRSNIFKMIESELMARSPEDLKKFLIKLSLLDHWAPELLDTIGGPALTARMGGIDACIHFDSHLNSWMIHPLLLEYLRGFQDVLTGEEKREVWIRAGEWCAANMRPIDALSYFEKTGDYPRIISQLYAMPLILPDRTARFMLEILDRASPEVYAAFPVVYVIRSRILISLGRYEQAWREMEAVIPRLEERERTAPADPLLRRALMGCHLNLGFSLLLTAIYTHAYDFVRHFEAGARYSRLSGYVSGLPVSVAAVGSYACRVAADVPNQAEEFERCIAAFTAFIPYTEAAMGGCMCGYDDLARGELAFFQGDFPQAETRLLTAARRAREKDQYEIENRALFYLLRLYLCLGQSQDIAEVFRRLEAGLKHKFYLNRVIHFEIVTSWYYVQTGQPGKLAPWVKDEFEESDYKSTTRGLEIFIKAKYHICEGRYPAALAVLASNAVMQDYEGPQLFGLLEQRVLETICRYFFRGERMGGAREGAGPAGAAARDTGALSLPGAAAGEPGDTGAGGRDKRGKGGDWRESLAAAYALAAPLGLDLPFFELGKNGRTLAEAALRDFSTTGAAAVSTPVPRGWLEKIHRGASAYAKKSRLAVEGLSQTPAAQGDRAPLSPRETTILVQLSEGLTREEIAQTSSLSPNTVKSVLRSIYNKLGAVNRADAIRLGINSGILPKK